MFGSRKANDDLRSQYRYLDLRRSDLSDNLRKRSQVAHIVRTVLNQQGVAASIPSVPGTPARHSFQISSRLKRPFFSSRPPKALANFLSQPEPPSPAGQKCPMCMSLSSSHSHNLLSNLSSSSCAPVPLTDTISSPGASGMKTVERIGSQSLLRLISRWHLSLGETPIWGRATRGALAATKFVTLSKI